MESENFEGVRCDITMHRTLYLSRKEGISDKQFVDLAKKKIVLPHNALFLIATILKRSGIQLTGLDLKDWNVDEVKYTICTNKE